MFSTLRLAADLDCEITVLSDCCADTDPAAHEGLLENIFPSLADVITSADWLASLRTPS